MSELYYDVAIIGAGPAGLAAAAAAKNEGTEKVVIIERDFRPGGILEQCIHPGFGLKYFKEELAGPEYAHRFIEKNEELGVEMMMNTMVLSIDGKEHRIHAANKTGAIRIKAGAIVLAMGCRERTRAQIVIPGSRPAGIYTAGTAQRFCNVQNHIVGNEIVIVGSGDIGMIMARRMTLEGAKVKAVVEVMPYLAGLTRNRVQCLDDFDIPLYLSHTIVDIKGKKRVKQVTVAEVDEHRKPIPGTEFDIDCDTILLSVGLIPENEVSKSAGVKLDSVTKGPIVDNTMMTKVDGIFACGNVVHVNDLVDSVSTESEIAGKYAAKYAMNKHSEEIKYIPVKPGNLVRYMVPQSIEVGSVEVPVKMYFRVLAPTQDVTIQATCGDMVLYKAKKKYVNPGEIERIQVAPNKLNALTDGEIVVNVTRNAEA
ncbi:NAD(P)/FAD-dependent oxidoreductase [Pseudoramibacter faecis]|uniref:NAD(P)/FAD-dependent oxidoreductase n=1 Tax=Pseudoramibacter faecis TaxID=3108534 RepID=UPI002E787555|nr:FAD-dependent oxidoreductase [Pseudoramibacter sp. HA2172]